MALYKNSGGSLRDRAQSQYNGAMRAMSGMTRENQTTEYRPGDAPATQIISKGIGIVGAADQMSGLAGKAMKGLDWLEQKFGTPDAKQQAASANSGAQATQQAQGPAAGGVQMNSGPQASGAVPENVPEQINMPDFINEPQTIHQSMPMAQGINGAMSPALSGNLNQAGEMAAESVRQQMYAMPEYMGGDPALAQQAANTASRIEIMPGPGNVTSGLTTMGSAIGGVGGGLAGRELGRAIGGDTGAAIGNIAGSLGGAYLGSMAAGSLGGVAAGAAAGSSVPGLGTAIGAGIGALTSLFF